MEQKCIVKKTLTRNLKKNKYKKEMYLDSKIVAWEWEQFNERKNKWQYEKQIMCHLYRLGSEHQPLNLGECNDGSKFTAVSQAVNQAKEFVNCCNDMGW